MISVRVFNYISEKSFGRNISLRLHLRLGLRLRTLVNMGTDPLCDSVNRGLTKTIYNQIQN